MKKLSQSGFSAVEALLVVILLGILVGTGLYVYHAQNNANKTLDTADKTAASQTQTIKPKTTAKSSAQFQIKEVGIEFTLPISLQDLTYGNIVKSDTSTEVNISTNALAKIDSQCAASESTGGIGVIEVGSGVWPDTNMAPFTLVKQLSNKWVAFTVPQMGCSSKQAAVDAISTDSALLQQALSTAQNI